jgi:hypothetical protein
MPECGLRWRTDLLTPIWVGIGQRLYVSRRAVQTHLAHVFANLHVASRTQLAAEVIRHPGVTGRDGNGQAATLVRLRSAPDPRRQGHLPGGPVRLSRDLPGGAPVSAPTAGALTDRDISQLADGCPAGAAAR